MNPQTDLQFWLTVTGEFNSSELPSCYFCNGSLTFKTAWRDAQTREIIQNLGEQFFNLVPSPESEQQELSHRSLDTLFESPGYLHHHKIRNRFLLWNIQRLMRK
jgi:hypothetical protein